VAEIDGTSHPGGGQDILSDAFSGDLRGMGPGYAELELTERPSEPVLCFADKTNPGAWNLPLFRTFADPFTTAGLVIDPDPLGRRPPGTRPSIGRREPPAGPAPRSV
jgi:fructose 1,6-bisphosphatase